MPNPNLALQVAADLTDRLPESAEQATALAVVALAFEQQTANLIAFYNMSDEDAAGLIARGAMTRDKFEALSNNIIERLGLA